MVHVEQATDSSHCTYKPGGYSRVFFPAMLCRRCEALHTGAVCTLSGFTLQGRTHQVGQVALIVAPQ